MTFFSTFLVQLRVPFDGSTVHRGFIIIFFFFSSRQQQDGTGTRTGGDAGAGTDAAHSAGTNDTAPHPTPTSTSGYTIGIREAHHPKGTTGGTSAVQ